MPRKPYLSLVPKPKKGDLYFGPEFVERRPKLQALIAKCVTSWAYVEAEMAVLLAEILRADKPAAVAVFQTLRRATNQQSSINVAAKAALSDVQSELVAAVLVVTAAVQKERADLAHGHFGISESLPDDLIWQDTGHYVSFRTYVSIEKKWWDIPEKYDELLRSVFVYKENDLAQLSDEIKDLHNIFFELINYLQFPLNHPELTSLGYLQLCNRPRIAQALAQIRQRNTPSTASQSP